LIFLEKQMGFGDFYRIVTHKPSPGQPLRALNICQDWIARLKHPPGRFNKNIFIGYTYAF